MVMRRGWTKLVMAAALAAVVGLAALTHTHAHASAQSRSPSGQVCLFCEHAAAPGPQGAVFVSPVLVEREPSALAPLAPATVALVVHPGQGPPLSVV
jgi:hypothetical protein